MDLPESLGFVFDESSQALVTSNVGSASAKGRSYTDPRRIWEAVIDQDAGVIRVVSV